MPCAAVGTSNLIGVSVPASSAGLGLGLVAAVSVGPLGLELAAKQGHCGLSIVLGF